MSKDIIGGFFDQLDEITGGAPKSTWETAWMETDTPDQLDKKNRALIILEEDSDIDPLLRDYVSEFAAETMKQFKALIYSGEGMEQDTAWKKASHRAYKNKELKALLEKIEAAAKQKGFMND